LKQLGYAIDIVCVYLDYRKEFDSVDHDIMKLIEKLNNNNIN